MAFDPRGPDEMTDEEILAIFSRPPVEEIPWTPEMALYAAGVDPDASHDQQVSLLRTAVDDDVLPEQAVDALVTGGYPELDDLDVDDLDGMDEDEDELPAPRLGPDGL